MTPGFLNILIFLGVALILFILWAASILFVYWDVYRRDLPWRQQILWIAVVALLPILGFVFYLVSRFLPPAPAGRKAEKARLKKRQTLPMHIPQREVYLPTIAVAGPERPAASEQGQPAAASTSQRRGAYGHRFLLVSGPGAGVDFVLKELPAWIGRGPEAAIRLDRDRSVSRTHAEIYERGGGLYIRDLNSTHGTQVNGNWIGEQQRLFPGDEIRIGTSILLFEAGEVPR